VDLKGASTTLAGFFSILVRRGAVKAKIHVTLKQGILDPQGKAIEHALDSLGFKNTSNVRVGKYMEVDVDEMDKTKADAAVKAMCEKLLANTIVEEYRYELQ
jgi:phosphoribosylformylglycinamidine synthase PurS subunit